MRSCESKIGETNTASNGQKMTIIKYRNPMDMDILFEDGTIVYNKSHNNFKKGRVKNPNLTAFQVRTKTHRKGESAIATNGQKMTIIKYRRSNDIDIQFEDGTIVRNRAYCSFLSGKIENPNHKKDEVERTNESVTAKNGQTMTITAYRSATDVDVQFEDGTTVTHCKYEKFKNGNIENPNYTWKDIKNNKKKGETNTATNGLRMTIIRYQKYSDIDVQFEDGTVIRHKCYGDFKKGKIQSPKLKNTTRNKVKGSLYHTQIFGIAHNAGYIAHYFCYCPICGDRPIATFEQIKNHKCNLNHPDQELLKHLIQP